jgi:serine/threonine protein kinase
VKEVDRSGFGFLQIRLSMTRQIASGMQFLHSNRPQSVLHRDLKPASILVNGNKYVTPPGRRTATHGVGVAAAAAAADASLPLCCCSLAGCYQLLRKASRSIEEAIAFLRFCLPSDLFIPFPSFFFLFPSSSCLSLSLWFVSS